MPDDDPPNVVSLQSPQRVEPTPQDRENVVKALEDILASAKDGKYDSFVFTALTADKRAFITDFMASPGTSLTELVGMTEILKSDLLRKMRGE